VVRSYFKSQSMGQNQAEARINRHLKKKEMEVDRTYT
jgi:hypothetical protein